MKKQLLTFLALSAIAVSTMAQVPNYVPSTGLVGWWPFNGNANDESGSGNNGAITGATLTQDRDGNSNAAYAFDGTQYISVNHSSSLSITTGQVSISCWSRRLGAGTFQHLISKHDFTSGPYTSIGYYLRYQNSEYAFACGTQSTTNASINAACPTPSEWNHVVLVYDEAQNNTKIYVNGSLALTVTNQNSNSFTSIDNLYFGVEHPIVSLPSGPQYLTGELDDIGIWNVALTEQEITDLYEAQGGPCLSAASASFSGLETNYTILDDAATLVGSPSGGVFFGEGVSGNQFDPSAAGVGSHSVVYTVVDVEGCISSYGLCTNVDVNVGIGGVNIGTDGGVDVYPNPSTGQYILELQNLEGLVTYAVYDARGREVNIGSLVASGNRTLHNIDLNMQADGFYTLQLQTTQGALTHKLVKN
jgi:hypothetical protein